MPGFLRLLPLVLLALAAGGFLWERGSAIEARAQRDAAQAEASALRAANAANVKVIADLEADRRANDQLIIRYADETAALRQQGADAAAIIRKLGAENAEVGSYLDTPIPPDLRRLLTGQPAVAGDQVRDGDQ